MAKIVVLATGGTIAGTAAHAHETVAYQAGQIQVDDLLGQIAGLDAIVQDDTLQTEQVAQINSKDMDFTLWQKLLQRCAFWLAQTDVRGLIITHGTDTLEETAFFLQHTLVCCPDAHTWQDKAVVLTCAMRPATARLSDGAQNLADACSVVRNTHARGVLVVCAGAVHSANHVQKIHPYRLDAFSSGDAGNVAWVENQQLRWLYTPPAWGHNSATCNAQSTLWHKVLNTPAPQFPWVEILYSAAGVTNRAIQALIDAGVQGIVIAGTGNATYNQALDAALTAASQQGVLLALSTRCNASAVVRNTDSATALQLSIALAYHPHAAAVLPPAKARVQLLLRLLLL